MKNIVSIGSVSKFLCLFSLVGGCGGSTAIRAKKVPVKAQVEPAEKRLGEEKYAFGLMGQGAVSSSGQLVGSCIIGDLPSSNILGKSNETSEYSGDGQRIEFEHKELISTNELRKSLSVSLGGKGTLGLSSVEGKASFFESTEIKQEDINILYKVRVINPEIKMSNVRLSPEALELLEKQGISALYKRCGDEAIIGYQTGGEINSLIQVSKRNVTSQKNIAASAAASGVTFSASGEIKIDESKMQNEISVSVKAIFSGGKGEVIKTSPAEFKSQAEGWAKVVAEHGVVVNLIRVKYSQLAAGALDPHLVRMQEFVSDLETEYDLLGDYVRLIKNEMHSTSDLSLRDHYIAKAGNVDELRNEILTKLTACRKSLDFPSCVDTQLTLKIRAFGKDLFEKRQDPSCGVAVWTVMQNPGCGFSDVDVPKTNFPACGVELYNAREEKKCRRVGLEGGLNAGETVCDVSIHRRPEYGVEKYKDCSVKEPMANSCRLEGGVPENFKECILLKTKI
jgi:hypothetical protein